MGGFSQLILPGVRTAARMIRPLAACQVHGSRRDANLLVAAFRQTVPIRLRQAPTTYRVAAHIHLRQQLANSRPLDIPNKTPAFRLTSPQCGTDDQIAEPFQSISGNQIAELSNGFEIPFQAVAGFNKPKVRIGSLFTVKAEVQNLLSMG